jgi:predicted esterase
MSDRWAEEFERERAPHAHSVPPTGQHIWQQEWQVASWREIAEWAEANGMTFNGNTNNVNAKRKALGKKPFALAKGLLQSGYRVY